MTKRKDAPAILVPTDFSDASIVAMSLAQVLARTLKRRIVLLHVFTYVPRHRYSMSVDWMVADIRKRADEQLRLAKERLVGAEEEPEMLLVEGKGEPAFEILSVVKKYEQPLVVLGTQSRTGIDRFFVGSTAEEVQRHTVCPVITVGPKVAPFWNRQVRQILLATDLTERSLGPLGFILSLWSPETHLTVLHIASPGDQILPSTWSDAIRDRLTAAIGEDTVRRNVRFCLLAHAQPSQAIHEVAVQEKVDLLAMGIHPAKTFTAFASPRTGFQIVMSAPCPVLSVCE